MPFLALLLCLWTGLTPSAHALEDPPTALGARHYHALLGQQEPGGVVPATRAVGLAQARDLEAGKRWPQAVAVYEILIGAGHDDSEVWLGLSRAWEQAGGRNGGRRVLQAAYQAHVVARDEGPGPLAETLFRLGRLYETRGSLDQARQAYEEGLALEERPEARRRHDALVALAAFHLVDSEVEAEQPDPRVCLRFSAPLARGREVSYRDYVVVEPAVDGVVSARGERLCVEGLRHGERYRLTVRSGLPARSGERLPADQAFAVAVPDRAPVLGFRGGGYVLPRSADAAVALSSVNVEAARLRILRVNDRALIDEIRAGRIATALDGYDLGAVEADSAALVWEGELTLDGPRNRELETPVAVGEHVERDATGIYLVVATPVGDGVAAGAGPATQWLLMSDLGLSAFGGDDGLTVVVRSLGSAGPRPGVELRLQARNHEELGRAHTDEAGLARFDPGLLRGEGGRAPAAVLAYGEDGAFNFLDLTRPAYDLSDRGVGGRAPPGPVDVFLYTDRGVYRPGESVYVGVLARDARGQALSGLPLTLRVLRPDGVEAWRLPLTEPRLGGYQATLALPDAARTGGWTLQAHAEAEGPAVGRADFQVQDFVPPRLALELTRTAGVLVPGRAVAVELRGRYLYGAPAAGLVAEAELVLREDPRPYPAHADFHFGLAQDDWEPVRQSLPPLLTDDEGRAVLEFGLDEVPDARRPLAAQLRVSLLEPGGRPVSRSLSLPYRVQPYAIGVRPGFADGRLPRGQEAVFDLLAVDHEGEALDRPGLRYELLREHHTFYWFQGDGGWDHRRVVRDGPALRQGEVDLGADGPRALGLGGLDPGAYRLEVYDPATGVASSLRFRVGWYDEPGAGDTPDRLQVSLDRNRYRAGETARVHLQAPFAGEVLLAVAGQRLLETRQLALGEEGATVDLVVSEDWGPGVYVTATVFRPGDAAPGPGRAVGVAWLGLDTAPHTLGLDLEVPEAVAPRQTLEVPVSVTGAAPGETVLLTLAAVDEGILQLTGFSSPDPLAHYLGKRRLGVELRDVYGQLVRALDDGGPRRSGGGAGERHLGAAPASATRSVALYSGIVEVGADGGARIPLELPDFTGRLRLMAVAWSAQRLGRAEAAVVVRDPLATSLYLPRFLAPGDGAEITLTVDDVGAQTGTYELDLHAGGALALEGQGRFSLSVGGPAPAQSARRRFRLQALEPGDGHLGLELSGPDGFRVSRRWRLSVRPAQPVASRRQAHWIAPREGLVLNPSLVRDYLPGTARVRVSLASRPGLDAPGLLADLARYPYGCLEQAASRGLGLLQATPLARAWDAASNPDAPAADAVQAMVRRVLSLQEHHGGFAMWHPGDPAAPWLGAYALDFLGLAREAGHLVPDQAWERGLAWLQAAADAGGESADELAFRAYALFVLGRAGEARLGDLRYLHDGFLERLPTRLAAAQLAAGLAHYGDIARARVAFDHALNGAAREAGLEDFGSELRDLAGLTALLAGSGARTEALASLVAQLASELATTEHASTQEQAWLLRAATALVGQLGGGELRLTVDGEAVTSAAEPYVFSPTPEDLAAGLTIGNGGEHPVWALIHTSGVPGADLPPTRAGFLLQRRYYTLDGQALDLPLALARNQRLVAVISGEATQARDHRALVVDLLPAGLELEAVAPDRAVDWLPALSEARFIERRDDRFVAALDLDAGDGAFTLAYVVRAVTPGSFRVPAVYVEDMYRPGFLARGSVDRMEVK